MYHDIREEDEKWEKKVAKIFQFCHATIAALVKADMAELPLRMYLQGVLALDKVIENYQRLPFSKVQLSRLPRLQHNLN